MAKIRELHTIKNDVPETLTVFIGYQVHAETLRATPVRVVQRDQRSVINISTGNILMIGTQFYFDAEDAIDIMIGERKAQIIAIEESIKEIEQFRVRVKKLKEEGKNAK